MKMVLEQVPELYHLPGFYEPFSAISHLFGAALFLVLGFLLLRRGRGNTARLLFLGVYAVSCVLLLSMSAVYHMVERGGAAHRVMERLDHGAIFLLIAGSFTPGHGLLFRGPLRWGPLLLVWTAALAGVTLKTVFFDDLAEWLGLTFYLTLGWCGVFSVALLGRRYSVGFVAPLVLGGLAYSAGAVAEFLGWPVLIPGVVQSHEVFHVAVLTGACLHWWFIWQFATGATGIPERTWRRKDSPASREANERGVMETRKQRVVRPFWVRAGLAGVPGRGAALAFFWISVALALGFLGMSLALAVVGVYSAYWVGLLLPGVGMLCAALWYGLAIRWVDQHDRW